MKRILAVILAISMVMAGISITATATPTAENTKVFSLDFSEYTEDNLVIKNGVTGSTSGLSVNGYVHNGEVINNPKILTAVTETGNKINYVSFSNPATTDNWQDHEMSYGNFSIDADTMESFVSDGSEMSVEFWALRYDNDVVRPDTEYRQFHGSRSFRYGLAGSDDGVDNILMESYYWNYGSSEKTWDAVEYARPLGRYTPVIEGEGIGKIENHISLAFRLSADAVWDHYVFTRKFIPDTVNVGTEERPSGEYIGVVYKNGNASTLDTATSTKFDGLDVLKQPNENFVLTIGGNITAAGVPREVFDGGIAEFNIYNYALDSTEVSANYNATKSNYANLAIFTDDMKIVSPANGSETAVNALAGIIPVEFSNYVDPETIKGKFTLKDSQGNDVPGGLYVETASPVSKTVNVKHGALTSGKSYTLTISTGIKSLNGISLESGATATFKASEDNSLFYLDFEDESEGVIDAADYAKYGINTIASGASASIVEVFNEETGDINMALQLGNPQTDDGSGNLTDATPKGDVIWRMPFVNADKTANGGTCLSDDKNFAVEIEYKCVGAALSRTATVYKGSFANVPTNILGSPYPGGWGAAASKAGSAANKDWPWVQRSSGEFNKTAKDSNGFIHTKQIFVMEEYDPTDIAEGCEGDGKNKSYTIHTTNVNDPDAKVLTQETRNLNNLYGLRMHQYVYTAPGGYIQIGKVAAYEVSPLEALVVTGYSPINKTLSFTLTDDINETTLSKILVTKPNGSAVSYSKSYNRANREVTLTFTSAVAASDVLTVSLAGVSSPLSGISTDSFTVVSESVAVTAPISFINENGDTIEALVGTETNISTTFFISNTSGEEVTPINVIALYSGDELVKFSLAPSKKIANGKTEEYTLELDLTTLPTTFDLSAATIKVISLKDGANLEPVVTSVAGTINGSSL